MYYQIFKYALGVTLELNYISLIVSILIVIYLPLAIYGIVLVVIFLISGKNKNLLEFP